MTGIISEGSKRLVIVSGRAHPELAQAVAKELGTEVLSSSAYDFANGETYGRRPQTRLRQAHHRGGPLLPLRPPVQETSGARAYLCPLDCRSVCHCWR